MVEWPERIPWDMLPQQYLTVLISPGGDSGTSSSTRSIQVIATGMSTPEMESLQTQLSECEADDDGLRRE